jgi:energy-coupling factor transporter ATP-binding protein EcfA2
MLASPDTEHEDELFVYSKSSILRMEAIYGANGSGKSNITQAIGFLQALVINSINHQPGDGIFRNPHKLEPIDKPTTFSIQFVSGGTRFAYGVSYTEKSVIEEYLYYWPNERKTKLFIRDNEGVSIAGIYKKDLKNALDVLKSNRLFLSCAANFSNVKTIEAAFLFFKEEVVVYPGIQDIWLNYSLQTMLSDLNRKTSFISFLQEIGSGIVDLSVQHETKKFELSEFPPEMPEPLKQLFSMEPMEKFDSMVDYGQFLIELVSESNGIKKLFEIVCPIIEVLTSGKVLIMDEIETNLHTSIVRQIISLFKDAGNKKCAQLILTTHDSTLLDLSLFRRDQIWFTELRKEDRSTDLYSLAELRGVRKDENIRSGYILGKYGAIPAISNHLSNSLYEAAQ